MMDSLWQTQKYTKNVKAIACRGRRSYWDTIDAWGFLKKLF